MVAGGMVFDIQLRLRANGGKIKKDQRKKEQGENCIEYGVKCLKIASLLVINVKICITIDIGIMKRRVWLKEEGRSPPIPLA